MTCGGVDCPAWCECVNGICQPTPIMINAVRFRTPDGRHLQAVKGGSFGLEATTVNDPQTWRTFRLAAPTALPLSSGDDIVLEVCDANWAPSGKSMRVPVTTGPGNKEGEWSLFAGGSGAHVSVTKCCVSKLGYYGQSEEWTFRINKTGGGPIATGDTVSISTKLGGFLFRTTGPQNGALVDADGTIAGQADTTFVIEFNEVMVGLGWRPESIKCQTCGKVTGTVTDASTNLPISGATVEAMGTDFKAMSGTDGRFVLHNPDGRDCVPEGNNMLRTYANYYQLGNNSVTVPAGSTVDVPIHLNCTTVSGTVFDANGNPESGAIVIVVGPAEPHNPVVRPDGSVITATTGTDGKFVIRCVPHASLALWTAGASTTDIGNVPPEGKSGIEIRKGCGNVIGTVTDFDDGQPITGATVAVIGSQGADTTGTDGTFRIECVMPSGNRALQTVATGYVPGNNAVNVPLTGDSSEVVIKLRKAGRIPQGGGTPEIEITPEILQTGKIRQPVSAIAIVMEWGSLPSDLDAHLTGPDGQGGRFHLNFQNRMSPPVPFVSLTEDDTDAHGPEVITVVKLPSTGKIVAGEYRYWVHNWSHSVNHHPTTFEGSGAKVRVVQDGLETAAFMVANATGNPDDDIWHVFNLQIPAHGLLPTRNTIQKIQPGNEDTVL